jgi:Tfx family DNA-binding protein
MLFSLKDIAPQAQLTGESKKRRRVSDGVLELEYRKSEMGFLTKKQFEILCLRERGFLQREIASELHMSRSSVSMIEARARKQVSRARQTLKIVESVGRQSRHIVRIERGTRLQKIPVLVLQEADKSQIHLRSNMVDILRMVKKLKGHCLSGGRTTSRISFIFNERGRLEFNSNLVHRVRPKCNEILLHPL